MTFEDTEGFRHRDLERSLEYRNRFHANISNISRLKHVDSIDGDGSLLNDSDLPWLSKLRRLENLDLSRTSVTDRGIRQIGDLALRFLSLNSVGVTDAGLANLNLEKLEELCLANTPISDHGVRRLSNAPFLRKLQISGELINDQSLAYVQEFDRLLHPQS